VLLPKVKKVFFLSFLKKVFFVQILKKFRLEPSEKTGSPLGFRNKGITLAPEGDQIYVKATRRNH
jgi:hypothetical protein